MSVRLAIGARGDLAGIVRVRACARVLHARRALPLFVLERLCSRFVVLCFKRSENPPLDSEE